VKGDPCKWRSFVPNLGNTACRELVDLLGKHNEELNGLKLDVFGNGDDQESVWSEAKKRNLPVTFFKGRDHADKMLQNYKVGSAPTYYPVHLGRVRASSFGLFTISVAHLL
jgi:digalactosyldiacylglycerol synthase